MGRENMAALGGSCVKSRLNEAQVRVWSAVDSEELIEEKTGETEHQRHVRELGELLQELRIVLPGVQVLFAFLLTVPFSARFGRVDLLQQVIFFATLACTAVSAGLLIAPSAHHWVLWRQQAREHRLQMANRFAVAGMVFLVLAMVGAMFLITDFLFGTAAAVATTVAICAFFVLAWFVLPIWYRVNSGD